MNTLFGSVIVFKNYLDNIDMKNSRSSVDGYSEIEPLHLDGGESGTSNPNAATMEAATGTQTNQDMLLNTTTTRDAQSQVSSILTNKPASKKHKGVSWASTLILKSLTKKQYQRLEKTEVYIYAFVFIVSIITSHIKLKGQKIQWGMRKLLVPNLFAWV